MRYEKFKTTHPDYESYDDTDYLTRTIPDNIRSALSGLIIRYSEDTNDLKAAVNIILTHIPASPSNNWGWSFLQDDLDDALRQICKSKFHKFMDTMGEVAILLGPDFVEDFNEALEDNDLGYYLDYSPFGYQWLLISDNSSNLIDKIDETNEKVIDVSQNAYEHLTQLKDHLGGSNARDIKDAVRDALSAMEAVIKYWGGDDDIKIATKNLRDNGNLGPDIIIKDGLSIWNHIHTIYPDVRHGTTSTSDISKEAAMYWIERMLSFINYLNKVCTQII